jgi:transcriptional regulator with PAS, ATPase and Fis domain
LKPSDCFFASPNLQEQKENVEYSTFNLELIEKQIIQKALVEFSGNISKTANELGLTRTSLYRRMEKYGL